MARQYSTRDFFRQMPNAMLARYFAGRTVFGELDFAIAHRLLSLHVGEQQDALPFSFVGAIVHIRIAGHRVGFRVELAGPLRVRRLAGGVHAVSSAARVSNCW